MLKVKDLAPLFSLKSQKGEVINLKDYRGQRVIIYFYPQDFTGGCTLQAKDFAKNYDEFAKLGYKVFGISKDSVESHLSFCTAYDLPFTLLSDPTREVIKAYGVFQETVWYGDIGVDTRRSTFVIDEKGYISHVFLDVDPKTSTLALLELLKK